MKILVIVLNYNGADETVDCLAALKKQTHRDFELYLVENSNRNKNDQIRILQDALQRLKLPVAKFDIQPKNTGFAGGVNLGIKYAMENDFDQVALLNSDAIADKDWLKSLLNAMIRFKADATTGLMLEQDGQMIINSADNYSIWGVPDQRDEGKPRAKASKSGRVFGATGGAVLYKTDIFRKIGLFDEKLFAYDEDVDIAWRANLAGFKFFYTDDAIVLHAGGMSSNSAFKTHQVFANLPVIVMKDIPYELLWRVLPRFILAYLMFFGYKILRGEGWPALRGIGRSICLWPHNIYRRHGIMAIFSQKFPDKNSRQKQLVVIKNLVNPRLPFRQIQRVKRFLTLRK